MLTYLATYRLRPAHDAAAADPIAPAVRVRILDASLAHAAARASWRLATVAAGRGWHADATELVAVELVTEGSPAALTAPLADPDPGRAARAERVALALAGCEVEARRMVAAAAVMVASAGARR